MLQRRGPAIGSGLETGGGLVVATTARACVWYSDGSPWQQTTYGLPVARRLQERGYDVTLADLRRSGGDVVQADLHVLAGGSTGVEDRTWMPGALFLTRRLVDLALAGDVQLRGICLGAQMIATALAPGSVAAAPGGLRARLTEVTWRDGRTSVVPSFHYCRIEQGPLVQAGGQVLAGNAHTPVQAYAVGTSIRATQFHPEWDPQALLRVLAHHAPLLASYGQTLPEAQAATRACAALWEPGLFDAAMALPGRPPAGARRRHLSRVA